MNKTLFVTFYFLTYITQAGFRTTYCIKEQIPEALEFCQLVINETE